MSSPYIIGGCRPASQIWLLAQWYAKSAALPSTMPDKVAATCKHTTDHTTAVSRLEFLKIINQTFLSL